MGKKKSGLTGLAIAAGAVAGGYLLTRKAEALDPANVILSYLVVTPTVVKEGELAVATVEATNTGGVRGGYTIELLMDSIPETVIHKYVVLDPSETKDVSFNLIAPSPGVYTIYVDGEVAHIMVEPNPDVYPYKCSYCDAEFATLAELEAHIASEHPIEPPLPPEEPPIYIPGTLTSYIEWGSVIQADQRNTRRPFKIWVTNNYDSDQLFNLLVKQPWGGWRDDVIGDFRNQFIPAGATIMVGSGEWYCNSTFECQTWANSFESYFSGPVSDLSCLRGSYTIETLTWTPTWQQFQAVIPRITNLTSEWQSLKYGANYYALAPGATIELPFAIDDVSINGRLWLEIESISGSASNVTEYDIWY